MDRKILDLYTDFLISSEGIRTATGLSAMLDGAISHDKITRFLSGEDYDSKALWKHVKSTVRSLESEDGVLIFDDTIEAKPHTDENDVVCWHFDHTQGRSVKGINILSALVRYGDTALPVAFEVVRKDQEYEDPKTGKKKRKSRQTKNEMFRAMVQTCTQNRLIFKYVLADSWFASKENMAWVNRKKDFIFAIKSNRIVALSLGEKLRGQFKSVSSLELEKDEAVQVYIQGLEFPVLLVKQVFTNKDGSTGVLFLVCSDLALNYHRITEIYKKRWRIEEYHKSIKSNTGLAKSPTRTIRTQCNHIFSCICAYIKLECLNLTHHLNHFALKNKLVIKANRAAFLELQKLRAANAHA